MKMNRRGKFVLYTLYTLYLCFDSYFFSVPIISSYLRVIPAKFLRNNNAKIWLTL